MNYEEARNYIAHIQGNLGSDYSLKEVTRLAEYMDRPDKKLQIVHIAGTNGKGSVLAYVSTVLKEAGYKVGRYISPTIFSYRERIQVNESYISREDLIRLTEKVKAAGDQLLAEGRQHPTMVEMVRLPLHFFMLRNRTVIWWYWKSAWVADWMRQM